MSHTPRPIRWGILGTGKIAVLFATGLQSVPDAEIAAVGSRTQEAADAFGDRFAIPRRHGSYEALAADPDVDVIYVATPHPLHAENSLLCLEAGKAVLCEKPFALNAQQAAKGDRLRARARALPDGGDVEPLLPGDGPGPRTPRGRGDRRTAAAQRRISASARRSTPPAGSMTRRSAAGRSSTSESTRSRSPR